MIITKLRGGLGNQMFQYAFGLRLALKAGTRLKLDHTWFRGPGARNPLREYNLGMFRLRAGKASAMEITLTKIFGKTIEENGIVPVDVSITGNAPKRAFVSGFWQNYEYLRPVEAELRADFEFAQPVGPESRELMERIRATQSVCLNVRRTDFLSLGIFVGLDYYQKAVTEMLRLVPDAVFYIASDDYAWCRENLGFIKHIVYLEEENPSQNPAELFQLMTACKHFIIPNSTFAWWAAFLSDNTGKKVTAPARWQNDPVRNKEILSSLILPGWTVLQ